MRIASAVGEMLAFVAFLKGYEVPLESTEKTIQEPPTPIPAVCYLSVNDRVASGGCRRLGRACSTGRQKGEAHGFTDERSSWSRKKTAISGLQ